jgi:hypothetical protein
MVTNPDLDSPEQCFKLPPSLELGDLIIDESTGNRFAQPSVAYYLRASASFRTRDLGGGKLVETSLPVVVTPHTEELPPTETDDFPSEFKKLESKILRRLLTGTTFGTMRISMQEPPTLTYDVQSVCSSTEAPMKLEFEPTSSLSDVHKCLQGLSFTVYSLVRVKTFYSVKSFPRPPYQGLLSSCGKTRLHDDVVKLETRTVRDVSWGFRFDLESQASGISLNTPAQLSPSSRTPVEGGSLQGNTLGSRTSTLDGKWISYWTIPIEVNGRLLPTFCSSLVARFYSLIIRVKIAGVRQEFFDFEVPLQVIHSSPDAALEPIRDDQRLLEFRRASETSWFGNEILVRYPDNFGELAN